MHFNEVQGPQCLEQLGKQGLACVTLGPLKGLQTGVDTEPGASNNTSREAGGGGSYTHLSLCWRLDCRLTEACGTTAVEKTEAKVFLRACASTSCSAWRKQTGGSKTTR